MVVGELSRVIFLAEAIIFWLSSKTSTLKGSFEGSTLTVELAAVNW